MNYHEALQEYIAFEKHYIDLIEAEEGGNPLIRKINTVSKKIIEAITDYDRSRIKRSASARYSNENRNPETLTLRSLPNKSNPYNDNTKNKGKTVTILDRIDENDTKGIASKSKHDNKTKDCIDIGSIFNEITVGNNYGVMVVTLFIQLKRSYMHPVFRRLFELGSKLKNINNFEQDQYNLNISLIKINSIIGELEMKSTEDDETILGVRYNPIVVPEPNPFLKLYERVKKEKRSKDNHKEGEVKDKTKVHATDKIKKKEIKVKKKEIRIDKEKKDEKQAANNQSEEEFPSPNSHEMSNFFLKIENFKREQPKVTRATEKIVEIDEVISEYIKHEDRKRWSIVIAPRRDASLYPRLSSLSNL